MITLIVREKFNIFINEETGRWFCFKYDINNQTKKDINDNDIKKLYSNYDEIKDFIEEIKKDISPINDKLLDMNYLVLHVSDGCNMKCKYCYAKDNLVDEKMNLMDSNIMIKSIDKFYHKNDFYVLFHGREPLTNYEAIIKTVRHYKNEKNIHFILQTNGMLLNDNTIKELRKLNVMINISIDGIDDFSNELRINGLYKLNYTDRVKKLICNYKFSPIIIIHKNNYNNLSKIMDFLINNKIAGASFNFLWPTKDNKELTNYVIDNNKLLNAMKDVFDKSIKNNKFIFKERELYLIYGRILKRHINNYMCNSAPCGAGRNCLSIYKNGYIYPCTMVNGQDENFLGTINDSNEDILNKIVVLKERNISDIEDCKSCPLRIFCKGGGCSGFIYNYTNNINSKSIYCDYYYEMIIYIIKRIYEMSKQKYFINF